MSQALRAPFPYFGGKSTIADLVWSALGDPKTYIEPFFGSGAVLLSRPGYMPGEDIETVNDANGHICNVWRALQRSPDEVARWCDWPVNHCDLSARKHTIIESTTRIISSLIADPEWCDPKLAGYWIWAASCWIGHGLDMIGQVPHISTGGKGVHAIGQVPHISHSGMGVHALGQLPHISHSGMGVHALGQLPHISHSGMGVREPYNTNIYAWFRKLCERLRYVRVVCGDWSRVCGGDWQDSGGMVGIFFDPPYGVEDRDVRVYGAHDSTTVAADVRAWCLERGERPSYRIVLAGYDEHNDLLHHGWTAIQYSGGGGYGKLGDGRGKENRHRETLYFSPHCLHRQERLFPSRDDGVDRAADIR